MCSATFAGIIKFISMKKIILFAAIILSTTFTVNAQGVLGIYQQDALQAPKGFAESGKNIYITKDAKKNNIIWINNLIGEERFYAVLHTSNDGDAIYNVPKQKIGSFQIGLGCVTYDADGTIAIALNNKANCSGVAVSPTEAQNSTSKGTKDILAGVQYVGHKSEDGNKD